jgi:hypothetical protein
LLQHCVAPAQHFPLHPATGPLGHLQAFVMQTAPVGQATQAVPHTDWPCGHWQVPETHVCPVALQTAPQVRQFFASVIRFVQSAPQSLGLGARHWHVPPAQLAPGLHAFPHPATPAPQFSGSVWVFVQNVVQSSGIGARHWQRLFPQLSKGRVQGFVHEPQAVGSVVRSRQRGKSASQRFVPVAHWHTPARHVAPTPHGTPQAPQLFASVW